jgi:predicted RND superfamily exporter protein
LKSRPKTVEVPARLNIALGLERFGLLAMRAPVLSLVVALVVAALAVLGIQKITIDDSLSQLFRTDTPEFKQFEQAAREFPSNEYDVLVVVESPALLQRDNIEKLRTLVTDLQLVDGARGIISLFSARQPAEDGGIPSPVFPEELPDGPAYQKLVDNLMANELVRGKLLSEDGSLALVVLSLKPEVVDSGELTKVVADIREAMSEDLKDSDLKARLSGVPVMQLEIRNALVRDRVVYNALGFLGGCAIAILFFRRISLMVVAAGPPLLAILFAVGLLGWLGFRLNMFLNVMTPLIMVISFSDSMQLTFAARDRMMAGEDKRTAFRNSIYIVGPACVLTHATAGLSFLGLMFSDSDLIRTFGEAGFISMIVALVTVLSLAPVLGILLIRNDSVFATKIKGSDTGVDALRRFCGWVAARMVSRPGFYSLVALILVGGLGAIYFGLEPRYRLADQVPDREQAVAASAQLDAKLTGANPIDVLIKFPKGAGLYDPQTLDVIAKVHSALEGQAGVGNVWSLETLHRWLTQKLGKSDAGTLKEYVDMLPRFLVRRFVSGDHDSVIISGRIPDKDASNLLPVVDELNFRLNAVRAAAPGYTIAVTGLAVIAARSSAGMINKLNRGLTLEFAFLAAFLGLAFRSFNVTLACLLPGIFPIVAAGTLLRLLGFGLQFSSVIALTVSFGLGLSATIHFLNRMWREDDLARDPAIAVERATVLVGPALILTSIVLACALAALMLSDLPTLRLFGGLSALAMLAAMFADLTILRPTITYLMRRSRGYPLAESASPKSSAIL